MSSATNVGAAAPWHLLEDYLPAHDVYDEMMTPAGALRPHCERFVRSIEGLGRHEFASRWDTARRAIRENGVTYNVYGDPQGVDRPWQLDMLPLLISPEEWSQLQAGLIQRTRLLNLMVEDLYGPQRLVKSGVVPPSLLYANPGFLRPCHGVSVPCGVRLHLHAVDLARSSDGQWSVLADRTQAPSGAGYALENRMVTVRSLPEVFRDCQVHRLASFFRAHRDALMSLAPSHKDQPKVVLLTPGPYNETYFEHAYLARYLGLTLVEGADLAVRDRHVFLKTLEGLQPVDVIYRRLDDGFSDPLELRSDSFLGVAGLVDAVRAGHVSVANALGSGVVETPAFLPFLPSICRELLGEEIRLPSVTTWWCGEPQQLQYVVDHVDQLVIKPAFASGSREPLFGSKMSDPEKAVLRTNMLARPHEFVGQEQVALSTAPVLHRNRLEPRPVVFRAYVAASLDSFVVMPGGLTRLSTARDVPVVSMQRGGGSKDSWVLSNGPDTAVSLLTPLGAPARSERTGSDLPSRVAEHLYWLGRYAERAEHVVRLLRAFVARLIDQDAIDDPRPLRALLHLMVTLKMLPEEFDHHMTLRALEDEIVDVMFKPSTSGGLHRTVADLRRTAAGVRDRLSIDTWRILNQVQQEVRIRHGRYQLEDLLAHLNRTITDLAAFSGMEMENMTRDYGWRFLDFGRRLERSQNLVDMLTAATELIAHADGIVFEPLLDVADSTMTYRRRYYARPRAPLVLDLLLADDTNTRALAFQLAAMASHIRHLPHDPKAPTPTREERTVGHMLALLRNELVPTLQKDGSGSAWLAPLLAVISSDLRTLSDTIWYYYFSHADLRVS